MVKKIIVSLVKSWYSLVGFKFGQKLLIALVVLFAIVVTSSSIFSVFNLNQNLLAEYKSKGIAITKTIARSSNQILFDSPYETTQAMIDSFLNTKGVAYLIVQDQQGEIIAHTFVPTIPPLFHQDSLINNLDIEIDSLQEEAIIHQLYIPEIGQVINIQYPILAGVGGYVHVGLYRELINRQIWQAALSQVTIIGFLFTLSIIASYIFIGYLSQDLNILIQGVKRVQKGDYDTQIQVRDRNEIGLLARAFNGMVAEVKRYAQNLQQSLKQLSDIKYALDQSAIVAIADRRGNITYANDKFCEISGYSKEELIGKNYRIVKSGYHTREFYQNLWKTISNGKVWRGEIKNKTKGGNYYWVDTTIVSFLDEQEKPFQYLSIQTEITARKEFEYALEKKVKERTKQLSKAYEEISNLNDKLKTDNLRMGTELDILRQMQQMILPTQEELAAVENLDIAGFMKPADEVGGDYYDVLNHEGVVTIAIGDVTGHGLESGILMVMAQTAVLTLKEIRESDPVKFLDTVNRTIYHNVQRMNSERNLTLAILNYSDQRLIISGQHEETIVVRSGGHIERIDMMDLGLPIGFEYDIADFIDHALVELKSGDGIVLYTDGITEAFNINNQQYGIERLCEVIRQNWQYSAEEIKQAAIADVELHIGTQKQFDDLTLLVVKQK